MKLTCRKLCPALGSDSCKVLALGLDMELSLDVELGLDWSVEAGLDSWVGQWIWSVEVGLDS